MVAGLVLANYFGGFMELGFWSIVFAAAALVVMIYSIASLTFAALPLPVAALYYIFQGPLGFPEIHFWPLALVTALVTAGLLVLLPRSLRKRPF